VSWLGPLIPRKTEPILRRRFMPVKEPERFLRPPKEAGRKLGREVVVQCRGERQHHDGRPYRGSRHTRPQRSRRGGRTTQPAAAADDA
jgi:hypothetical protein